MHTYSADPLAFKLTIEAVAALYIGAVLLTGIIARALTRGGY